MGFLDKVRGVFGINDTDEFDEELEEMEETEEETPIENTYKADFTQNSQAQQPKKEKVTTFSTTVKPQFVLVRPVSFKEAVDIADNINMKKTVVLNLEECELETARRLVDFLSGVAYANTASLNKIATSTFIIAPENADISGLVSDETEKGN